jgi:hypothetical protein
VGSPEEKQLLAQYVQSMAAEHMAQPREAVGSMLKELLRLRKIAVEEHRLKNVPPLNKRETEFCGSDKIVPGDDWFKQWQTEFCIAPVTKASLQSASRAECYTLASATKHLRDLDHMLERVGFLVPTGKYKDCIIKERTFSAARQRPAAQGTEQASHSLYPHLPTQASTTFGLSTRFLA